MDKKIVKATIDDLGWPVIDGQRYTLMGEHLYLDGEDIGRFHFMKKGSYTLVLKGPEGYKSFAQALMRDEVQISCDDETLIEFSIADFENRYLKRLEAIHRDGESFFKRDVQFPVGERVPKEVLEENEG